MKESLIKYLAGLLDADGALSFHFDETGNTGNRTGRYTVNLRMTLAAADTIDTKGFVASLPALTGMGTATRHRNLTWWRIQKRADLEKLLPRIIKHMVVKARHWQWLLETWRTYRGAHGECLCDEARRAELSAQSKLSRKNVGPIKPKNHPTWAWLAGYLDGDGTYQYRQRRMKDGTTKWVVEVSASAHVDDASVLEFLHRSLGGRICNQYPDGRLKMWTRPLGHRNRSFTLRALPKLARHSNLKRHKIDAILNHSRQQRLSVSAPTGDAIV